MAPKNTNLSQLAAPVVTVKSSAPQLAGLHRAPKPLPCTNARGFPLRPQRPHLDGRAQGDSTGRARNGERRLASLRGAAGRGKPDAGGQQQAAAQGPVPGGPLLVPVDVQAREGQRLLRIRAPYENEAALQLRGRQRRHAWSHAGPGVPVHEPGVEDRGLQHPAGVQPGAARAGVPVAGTGKALRPRPGRTGRPNGGHALLPIGGEAGERLRDYSRQFQVDLSALGIRDPVEEAHRRERQRTFRACLVIGAAVAVAVTVLLGVASMLAWRYRAQPSAHSSACPTAACAEYAAILTNAIDERNRPCDNYYQHICSIEVSVSNNARESPAVTFSLDKEFITTLEMLKRHRMTKRILGHFKLTYATFASTPELAKDKGRSDQLFKDLMEMSSKFGASTSYENTMADSMPLELHPRNIPTVAPSTDYDTWNAALRRHFNQSFDNIPSVTLKRPKYFRAVFMLHAAFGDTKTLDFFGWLSLQSLIHFTSPKLLSSYYYSSEEQAFTAHRSHCLAQTHAAFRSALNAHIWMVVPKATLQDVRETANDVWRAFAELLGEENRTLVGSSKPPPKDPYQEALFLYRSMSKPEKVNAFYASVPPMKMKPLYNYVAVKGAMRGLMRDPEFRFMNQEWKIEDSSTLRGYSLVPPELEFPWLGPGRPYALALAGLGVRMAATLYFQSVARLANASETTAANFRCLAPSAKDEDGVGADIPAAAAALRVVWRTWEAARRANATPAINLGPVPSDAAVFAFHCWFSCGLRPYHEMICNLPLMHSSDFARVYGCKEGSRMNPKTKCAIRV
ncbi:uncharacterized protein [Dermacentor albipictus]|uniref:uncharacterized protein isoform X1 n=1 Tax=Dermacentor albipictus TaxID=60249 RepID=UPI0038FC3074